MKSSSHSLRVFIFQLLCKSTLIIVHTAGSEHLSTWYSSSSFSISIKEDNGNLQEPDSTWLILVIILRKKWLSSRGQKWWDHKIILIIHVHHFFVCVSLVNFSISTNSKWSFTSNSVLWWWLVAYFNLLNRWDVSLPLRHGDWRWATEDVLPLLDLHGFNGYKQVSVVHDWTPRP